MATFKISWEIEIDAETPLAAAKEAQKWMKAKGTDWQFYVQEEHDPDIYSVDLAEEDDDAVLLVHEYDPLIK